MADALSTLVRRWRARAESARRNGGPETAEAFEACADELESLVGEPGPDDAIEPAVTDVFGEVSRV
jgi:hypothetical protein